MLSVIKLEEGIPPQYELVNSGNSYCHLYQHKTKLNKFIGSIIAPNLFGERIFYFLLGGVTSNFIDTLLNTEEGFALEEFDFFEDICCKRALILTQYNSKKMKRLEPALSLLNPNILVLPFWICAFLSAMKKRKDIQPVIYSICQIVYGIFDERLSILKEKTN